MSHDRLTPYRDAPWHAGRPVLRSGLRQVALGGLAIAITYGVGTLIGHHAA